jgi:hypothetical protein
MLNIINEYTFGNVIINGHSYTSDLIIFPHRINSSWWRNDGHHCSLQDLQEAIDFKPAALIIGTGSRGTMKVDPEVIRFFEYNDNMILIAQPTDAAVNIFNKFNIDSIRVIAALHLTS